MDLTPKYTEGSKFTGIVDDSNTYFPLSDMSQLSRKQQIHFLRVLNTVPRSAIEEFTDIAMDVSDDMYVVVSLYIYDSNEGYSVISISSIKEISFDVFLDFINLKKAYWKI